MVELLDINELSELMPMAHRFSAESGGLFNVKEDVFVENWTKFYSMANGGILVYRKDDQIVGALGFLIYNDILNGDLCSTEAFWFVDKQHRGIGIDLLNHYENLMKSIDVKKIIMVHLSTIMPERLKLLYESRGYKQTETHYMRELWQ